LLINNELFVNWRRRKVLITGGAGFIGSNLAHALALLDAKVVILDNFLFEGGALAENLVGADVEVHREDIRYADLASYLRGVEVVFNLAGQTGHIQAQRQPLEDLEINTVAQLRLIAAVRQVAPAATVVHVSTRQVYGRPENLPVSEEHPVRPPDANAVSKLAGETYWKLEHDVHARRVICLRLTNTYGPRQRIIDANQNFFGFWIGQVLRAQPIEIWGGEQLRDLAYVDDVVEALLIAADSEACTGRILNIGGAAPLSLNALAEKLHAVTGVEYTTRAFPRENALIDIGSYYSDDSAFRALTGWSSKTSLDDGIASTLGWFTPRLQAYTGPRARAPY
jgi:nucleoside-diphosphate-sugar epimerase